MKLIFTTWAWFTHSLLGARPPHTSQTRLQNTVRSERALSCLWKKMFWDRRLHKQLFKTKIRFFVSYFSVGALPPTWSAWGGDTGLENSGETIIYEIVYGQKLGFSFLLQFSKCDFWNLEEIWDRNGWPTIFGVTIFSTKIFSPPKIWVTYFDPKFPQDSKNHT